MPSAPACKTRELYAEAWTMLVTTRLAKRSYLAVTYRISVVYNVSIVYVLVSIVYNVSMIS